MEQVKTQVNELGKRRKIVAKPNKGSVLSCDDLHDLETIDSMKKSLIELMPVIRYIGAGSKAKHTDEQYIAALQDQSYHSQVKCHWGVWRKFSPPDLLGPSVMGVSRICSSRLVWGVWKHRDLGSSILDPVSMAHDPWLTIQDQDLDPASIIQDPGYRILDLGSQILDPASRIQDPGSWILDPGSGIHHPASRILDVGF